MKKPVVKVRNAISEIVGLLFFTQCLEELLFDHSDDSYKAPALITLTRVMEFLSLAVDMGRSEFGKRALQPVFEELVWSIKQDPVISRDCRQLALQMLEKAKLNLANVDELVPTVHAVRLHFEKYGLWLHAAIREIVIKGHEKERIRDLAGAFIGYVEYEGFSRRYIYYVMQRTLLRKFAVPAHLAPAQLLENFIERFKSPEKKWHVVFRSNTTFKEFPECAKRFSIEVRDESPVTNENRDFIKTFFESNQTYPCYLLVQNIEAKDPFGARQYADIYIEKLIDTCKFHCHDLEFRVSGQGFARDPGSQFSLLLDELPNPMLCDAQRKGDGIVGDINATAEIMIGNHLTPSSTRMFVNALEYHRAGLETGVPENQLVDLWAALEGFLPQPADNIPRIVHYVQNLVPALMLTYAEKLFRDVLDAISHANEETRAVINNLGIPGDGFEQTVAFIVAKEFGIGRQDAYRTMDQNPLLKFRIYQLNQQFGSKRAIHSTLKAHKLKVSWHIQRIYITRNQIMHSAKSLPYLRTLVENLHSYVDILIEAVSRVCLPADTMVDIADAIHLLNAHEEHMLRGLRIDQENGDVECDLANFKSLVFGGSNPLSPFATKIS